MLYAQLANVSALAERCMVEAASWCLKRGAGMGWLRFMNDSRHCLNAFALQPKLV